MQLATSTFIWVSPFSSERLDLFSHAARLGSDVLEICIEDPALISTDEIAEAAASAGIGISVCGAYGPSRDVSSDDPEVRAQGLEYLGTCIDIAAALGSPLVSGPMYSATGKTRLLAEEARKQQREWAADGIRRAADYAAGHGVRLAVEPSTAMRPIWSIQSGKAWIYVSRSAETTWACSSTHSTCASKRKT